MFKVMAMVGDFPLEHQPFWDEEYSDLALAKKAASATWVHFKDDPRATYQNFQVNVTSDDGETVDYLIDLSGDTFEGDAAHDRSDELCETA